jgi:hypothetical protein
MGSGGGASGRIGSEGGTCEAQAQLTRAVTRGALKRWSVEQAMAASLLRLTCGRELIQLPMQQVRFRRLARQFERFVQRSSSFHYGGPCLAAEQQVYLGVHAALLNLGALRLSCQPHHLAFRRRCWGMPESVSAR